MKKLVDDNKLSIDYLVAAMDDGKVTRDELIASFIATGLSAEEAKKLLLEAIEDRRVKLGTDILTLSSLLTT